jgi:serine/threonine protein kinase/Tol biopolymer transport system component
MTDERWHRITGIYHAARERDPALRDAFLAEACLDDLTLRREVEAMLDGLAEAGQFGESPLFPSASSLEPGPSFGVTQLAAGSRLGPYEITASLGAGGMGEVYRAHDPRLSRDVAIKTLPSAFSDNPDRLTRFRREARMLASLNHPNIGAIYGLERSDDVDHLVLELVEGESLRGPLPVAKVLDCARQVAEALEAAHDKGIVHRDLKPANIKITPDGRVKVLDFGLAKAVLSTEERPDCSQLTTATGLDTVAGQIVGSPPYMSPEQARGKAVDERTDIWAFGCLLYELLSGKRAFLGEDLPSTIAAVLEREPDWTILPGATPANIRELMQRCLHKDPTQRLQDIADARKTIERAQRGRNRWQIAAIATASLAVLAMGTAWFRTPDPAPNRSEWVQLTRLPDSVSQPALSPDGRMLTFIRGPATFLGPGQVYVKMLPDGEPVQLTNDDQQKVRPVFSPDGTRIAYTVVRPKFLWDTWVVPVLGGAPQPWLRNASGLVWTGPQQVMFAEMRRSPHMGIVAADERRIAQRDVYMPTHEHAMAHFSYASPDGEWVLIVEMDEDHAWGPCRVLPLNGKSPARQVGPPDGACTSGAWSPDGTWMYVTSNAGGVNHIWRQQFPDGEPEQVTFGPTAEEGIALAPDGRSVVTAAVLQNVSIWLHDGRGERQISPLEGIAANPKFTPDGKKLCYAMVKETPTPYSPQPGEVWVADLESGRSVPVAPGFRARDYDVSADGRQIVMDATDPNGERGLWLVPLDRQSPPRKMPTGERGRQPRFGPDGDIFFRRSELTTGFAYRIRPDGSQLQKALEQEIALLLAVSRNQGWIVAWSYLPDGAGMALQGFPPGGRPPVTIAAHAQVSWSPGGNSVSLSGGPIPDNRSYIIPLAPGEAFPRMPAEGFRSEEEIAQLPGARRIEALTVPGPTSDVYAFYRGTTQRNLYRVPLH